MPDLPKFNGFTRTQKRVTATMQSKHGHEAEVSHHVVPDSKDGVHVIHVDVVCGSIKESHKIKLGPTGPTGRENPPTLEELQSMLDRKKQQFVDEAAFKHTVNLHGTNLK